MPGHDTEVANGGKYGVYDPWSGLYAGTVTTTVSDDGLTITNVTDPGHVFYDGEIVRSAFADPAGNWYVGTHGYGNDVFPGMATLNQLGGPGSLPRWINRCERH